MMFIKYSFSTVTHILLFFLLFYMLMSCRSETPSYSATDVEVAELEQFETIVAYEDNILANPSVIKYDRVSNLFVYDGGIGKVLKLDSNSGSVINEFGRMGRGPGEFMSVNNMFLTEHHLFIVDIVQRFIHKYDRNFELISTRDVDMPARILPPLPPLPPLPSENQSFLGSAYRGNIDLQPHVTGDGNVLLPRVQTGGTIYELTDWKRNTISDIGEVPEGSSFEVDFDEYRAAVSSREVPALFKPNSFPVSDKENPEEYFLVFSAIPMIAKYNSTGQKLWETEITGTPEVTAIENMFYETMDQIFRITDAIGPLRKYTSGIHSPEGALYLAVYTYGHPDNSLWIHQFDSTGELVRRYKLISEVELTPYIDMDFTGRRIFVVTEEAEIRAYSF